MRKIYSFLILLVIFITITHSVWGQNTATITGNVKDNNGEAIIGASVILDGTSTGSITDVNGNFTIENIEDGNYVVIASFIGYKSNQQSVEISAEQISTLNFTLEEDLLEMDAVIVSGNYNPATKLESSVAITTLNSNQIENRMQRGVGDLMQAVPGIQVVNGLGEVGNNVAVRGLPRSGGLYRYISMREEGLPIFEVPNLNFATIDGMFKVDETIERMEAVRGGTSAIFASNNPGAIINFVSKTGGNKLAAVLKFTLGSQGMYRTDFNVGGPLADKWKFNVGGYYSYDQGVRGTNTFPANVGGQIKANITREFKNGYIRFYTRFLSARSLWLTGTPYENINEPEEITGTTDKVHEFTTYSQDYAQLRIPDPFSKSRSGQEMGFITRDFTDGFSSRVSVFGAEFFQDLGNDWTITLRGKTMRSQNEANLILSDVSNPIPAVAFANPMGPARLQYVSTGEVVEDATTLNGNGLVLVNLAANLDRPVSNTITDFQVTKTIGTNSITAGVYFSSYNSTSQIRQNTLLSDIAEEPRLLQVTVPALGRPVAFSGGFFGQNIGFANAFHQAQVAALYIGDEWRVNDNLRIDFGLRYNRTWHSGQAERPIVPGRDTDGTQAGVAGQSIPVGYAPFIPTALDTQQGQWGSGIFRNWDYDFENVNFSIGANYKLNDKMAVFARGSLGHRNPDLTLWEGTVDNNNLATGETLEGKVEEVWQAELGYKVGTSKLAVFATGFYTENNNLLRGIQTVQADGSLDFQQIPTSSRIYGGEFEVIYSPLSWLQLQVTSIIQNGRWTDFRYVTNIQGTGEFSGEQVRDYSGNKIRDNAEVQFDATATFNYSGFEAYVNYRWFGERPATLNNNLTMDPYGLFYGGLSYSFPKVTISAQVANLFNTVALQQTAVRIGENVTGTNENGEILTINPNTGDVESSLFTGGTFALPRNFVFSIAYRF